MTGQTFTRCPGCATVFRVSAAQLALREGQVRCGHCRAVFDANDHRVAFGARPDDDLEMPDELAAGRPTVTPRNADALLPVEPATPQAESNDTQPEAVTTAAAGGTTAAEAGTTAAEAGTTEATPAKTEADASVTQAETATTQREAGVRTDEPDVSQPAPHDAGLRAERFEWRPRKPLRERPRTLYGVALALLVAALFAQALFEYRDALAAHAPFTRPVLQAACGVVGCTVGPLRDAAALSIEASDLQADPAHRGLLKLTATIRNRASYAIAWPYVELTLTDASDSVVARRALTPAEYAGGADGAPGIPGNGEHVFTLFLDASETSQAGYRIYLFYP